MIGIPVGTIVQLVSGGPNMMVTSMHDQIDGLVQCEWFVDGEVHRDCFDAANLRVIAR